MKQGDQHRTLLSHSALPFAEQQMDGDHRTALLATDIQGSIIYAEDESNFEEHCYSAYGFAPTLPSTRVTVGFNGKVFDSFLNAYLLGNGYRAYAPRHMRFSSADDSSPFGQGGVNAYCYCAGDPVNYHDPSGHARSLIANFKKLQKIQIEIDHPQKPLASENELWTLPKNTANFTLPAKTSTRTFHRETLVEIKNDNSTAYVNHYNFSEYIMNEVELRQLTAPLDKHAMRHLSESLKLTLHRDIKQRADRNKQILKLGNNLFKAALDPKKTGIHIRTSKADR
ncbi:hypothetical protein GQL56_17925 [Pseudomonas putida]|nr:hypothetical protein [Pseudomonas putida]